MWQQKYILKTTESTVSVEFFFIIDQFRSSGLAALADNTLGAKGINTRYSYSNVIENLTSVFVSGGEALEDVNFFRQEAFKANPDYRFCSADTIGRDLRGLDPQLLRLARREDCRQQGFRSGGDLACEKVRLPLRSGAVPLGLTQPPVAPAAVHQPSLRPAPPVVPFSYGFPPIPIRLGGGIHALPSAKNPFGGRATVFFVNRGHICAALRHPPEAEGGICRN